MLRVTVCGGDDPRVEADDFRIFRKDLFVDRLGWALDVKSGKEVDQFDTSDCIYAIILRDDRVVAGFRAIRADRPYLAKVVFPQLAVIASYPEDTNAYEISRFGIDQSAQDQDSLAKLNYGLMFAFARSRGARCLVALADPKYERYLRLNGIRSRRYGPAQIIGHDRNRQPIEALAGEIPLTGENYQNISKLVSLTSELEIDDATLLFRRRKISA